MTTLIGLLIASALATSPSSPAHLPYSDVPPDSWYSKAITELLQGGLLDASQKTFRPAASAKRAEFIKLTLAIAELAPSTPPLLPSFDDVPATAWYFAVMEEAAKQDWVRGDGNCVGLHPCKAHPDGAITRAQAAALLVRAFGIERKDNRKPPYIDVGMTDWFTFAIMAASDRCLLSGDPLTLRIRPQDALSRGEMAVMLRRMQLIRSGTDICKKAGA